MNKVAALALSFGMAMFGAVHPVSAQEAAAAANSAQSKVVYHINDAESQALGALRSMRNQLDTNPDTKIVAVAHADGIEFLQTNYKDADTVGALIGGLAARGVSFQVCEITMRSKGVSEDDFVLEAEFVPSGVARITELQNKEGYAYIKF